MWLLIDTEAKFTPPVKISNKIDSISTTYHLQRLRYKSVLSSLKRWILSTKVRNIPLKLSPNSWIYRPPQYKN